MTRKLSKLLCALLCLALVLSASVLAFAEEAAATGDGTETVGTAATLIGTFLPMVLILVVFWFFLIRPQRKKDKQVKEMLAALKEGDRVCTIGGIYGTILNVRDEKTVTLAIGPQDVPVVFARWAIRNVEEITVENDSEVLA